MRRIQGVLNLVKKNGVAACEDACAAAQMTLHQIDPLIRELNEYRDLIEQRIDFEDKTA